MTATRQAAWRTGPANGWHDDLVWYAAAVHQMRLRTPGLDDFFARLRALLQPGGFTQPAIDELNLLSEQWSDVWGLGYHSQIHGTFLPVDRWPQVNGNAALWKECAHNHWFFLPWHRAYLLEFEAICRGWIVSLGGPAEWGLPYWNYSDFEGDAARLGMPLPLRGETLPADVTVPGVEARTDGLFPNPLWIPGRVFEGDTDPADTGWADASTALLRHHFANQQDTGRVSFGGGVIEDALNQALFHDQTQEIGQLDASPHGSVHVRVHGAMALFETAGLDPVFWMHHCNVDRLWETYARDLGHGYPFENGVGVGTPAQQSWNDREFWFLRGDSSFVAWTAPSVLDLSFLDYAYDTTAPPTLPAAGAPTTASEDQPFGLDQPVPEPVSAAEDVHLAGTTEALLVGGSATDRGLTAVSFPAEATWVLRFDGIRCARPAQTSYEVYLGLDDGLQADPHDAEHHVGLLSLFGVLEASRDDGTSPGDGQRRQLDATAAVRAQSATLHPLEVAVRLVPLESERDLGSADLTVGRLSLEFT
ncbi:hypothetical protein ASG49_08010 [Marmoricola sp. Leaf446]|uniref:tyrosinase family protein n=1 Tax=Marmoricola sp. Leaf446 TaxID=1736379 RepID=UPI0006FC0B97|nr:tyrosinase family protein [Marmoricola sp. Leaf446]KQT94754.1 hypothetical protein ASG49_08010 [Marmoricola sp. Leaf446]